MDSSEICNFQTRENQILPLSWNPSQLINWADKCHFGLFNENEICSFACSAQISRKMTIQPLIVWTVLKFAVSKQEKRNQGLKPKSTQKLGT